MAIMAEAWQQASMVLEPVAESSHLDQQAERVRNWAWHGLLKPQSPPPLAELLQQDRPS